ncbi:MAG: outer membrane beta-barrel domain-containing protein [Proteobacteria bacterium]|nr:outer membrane beta-barrel domain-containing protein [Cystobacterineae bacterium]MCL2315416.1 outer membrane beta-barrel domain-containing protein [Pseudomonadota bacterium]
MTVLLSQTTKTVTVCCLLGFLWGARAQAQEVEAPGTLDFSELDDKEAPPPPPPPPPVVLPSQGAAENDRPTLARSPNIIQTDRVRSVQKKLYMKRGRFELAPYVAFCVNDPLYTKWGGSIRAAYYLADTLALSARFTYIQMLKTDDVRMAKRFLSAAIFPSEPEWWLMASVEWSPIYAKVSIFNSILHFDAGLVGGAGIMKTATYSDLGFLPAFDIGVNLRVVVKDFLAVNVAWVNTSYVDKPFGLEKSGIQNIQMIYAGLSIFFPFKSTWREAE